MNQEATPEQLRQAALDQYGIVDSFAEQAFDDITRLAAETFGTPIALITFLDHDRNWFKSRIGMAATQSPREFAICEHLLLRPGQVLVINDASTDDRFCTNPLVVGEPHIRFYAGAPLIAPSGHVLGALCAIDTQPREVSHEALQTLLFLAKQVVAELERRRLATDRDATST